MCCDLMSIVQVAFVNPLINELCMYYVWIDRRREWLKKLRVCIYIQMSLRG